MTNPIVGGGSATLAPAKKSSVPKDPKEEKGGIKYAERVASRRPRLEVEASLMQYGALPAAASSIAPAPAQDPLLLIPGPYIAIPPAQNQEPAPAQQPPVGAQNSQVPNPVAQPVAQPAPQQAPLAAPLPAAVGEDVTAVAVAPAPNGVVVQAVQQEPAPVQAQAAPAVVVANLPPQNPVAQPAAPQPPIAVNPVVHPQPPLVAAPLAFAPLRPAEEFIPAASGWRRAFNFVYQLISALFYCLCCCFVRRPQNRRRALPAQQQVGIALPIAQAAPVSQAQAKMRVREFLKQFPDQSNKDLRNDFYAAFKRLPSEAQNAARENVYEAHFFEIERIMRGTGDDQKGASQQHIPRFQSQDLAIEYFIHRDFFNHAARKALQKFFGDRT